MIAAWLVGCVKLGRVFAPEEFAVPPPPPGALAAVTVSSGWRGEAEGPYRPDEADPGWWRPVEVTDRGLVAVRPLRDDVELEVYVRHDDLVPRDFRRVVVTTGILPGRVRTALWPMPSGPLPGPFVVPFDDLQSPFAPEPMVDGDLVWVRLMAPGAPSEDYVFRARSFGLRAAVGAGVWVPLSVPGLPDNQHLTASPALVATLGVHHRWRSRSPTVRFFGEQLGVVGGVGLGSTVLEQEGPLAEQARGAFDSAVVGGGIRVFQFADAVVLVNASSAFRDGPEASTTFAIGVDAVRATFVTGKAVSRLLYSQDPRP